MPLVLQKERVTVTVDPVDDNMACGLGLFWDNILRLLEEMDLVLSHRVSVPPFGHIGHQRDLGQVAAVAIE